MIEGHENKNIPVLETTIEGAQKRIASVIDWYASYDEGGIMPSLEYIAVFLDSVGDEMAAMSTAHNSLHERFVQALAAIDEWKDNFETVNSEAARRLNEKIELQKEIDELNAELDRRLATAEKLRKENEARRIAILNNLHAAHDNR
jgi:chromosome segregation ATPase